MKELLREIHRRSLWQVVGIYLAGSWAVIEVSDHVVEKFGLPEWTYGVAVLLLLIGFPIVTATAFVQEGVGGSDPEGDGAKTASGASPRAGEAASGAGGDRSTPLEDTTSDSGHSAGREATAVHRRLFTWRNAILGGVAALLLLATLTGGYLFFRSAGIGSAGTLVARGVLDDRSRVIVADFESPTGDSSLARTVTEAFRIDLSLSRDVRVAEPAQVKEALRRMERPGASHLDPELAREVALREGIPALISGEIGAAGAGFLLSARVIRADDGQVLVSHREAAANAEKLIPAIDKLSKRLRERIGESMGSLGADRPLEEVTTADLDALRKYTQAVRVIEVDGELRRGISLLEEAIADDSAFAMAYRKLGIALFIQGEERERQIEMFTRAFEHRDRLTEIERYMTIATYHTYATYEPEKAIAAYETLLELDPTYGPAINNLALVHGALGNEERAEELLFRAIETDSATGVAGTNAYTNVLFSLVAQGKEPRAREVLDEYLERFPDNPGRFWYVGHMAAQSGDYAEADRVFETFLEERRADPSDVAAAHVGLAAVDATRGRLQEAEVHLREAMAARESQGLVAEYIDLASALAAQYALVLEDQEGASRVLMEALDSHDLESVSPLDRPYPSLAYSLATAGRAEEAAGLLAEYERSVPAALRQDWQSRWQHERAHGRVALTQGSHDAAIEAYRAAAEASPACDLCALPDLAEAYDRAGVPDSAVAVYERYLTTPALPRTMGDQFFLGPTHERLGQLYEARGDLENAARHYARFVELWAEADPELQPRVRAAQERLEAIVAERG